MATSGKAYGPDPPKSASTAQARVLVPVTQTEAISIESDGKQVYLKLMPPGAYQLEDLWKKGPFCLTGLD